VDTPVFLGSCGHMATKMQVWPVKPLKRQVWPVKKKAATPF
jgi:hypothetical protein